MNLTDREEEHDLTVGGFLGLWAVTAPQSLALDVDGEQRTWGELAAAADERARYMAGPLGVRAGDHVAILMPNSVDWVAWAYACGIIGAVVVPLNIRLTAREFAYQLRHSGSTVVISDRPNLTGKVHEALSQRPEATGPSADRLGPTVVVTYSPAPAGCRSFVPEPSPEKLDREVVARPSPEDTLILQYTSGSTAQPKGVMLTHRQILTNAEGVVGRLHIGPEDRICSPSPFFHVAGTTLLLFLGLVSGASVYSFGSFEPARVLRTIEEERITIYNGVEAFFLGLHSEAGFTKERVGSIRSGWIAASPALTALVHEEMGMAGIVNCYGLSEASPNVSIPDAYDPVEVRRTAGRPHSGGEIRIVERESDIPVQSGTSGLIEVRGPCVMKGYHADPVANSQVFTADGWLRTGDLGRLDEAGNLTYEGRAKDMMRVGGENVAPAEVEAVLLEHPAVAEVAVFGEPHPDLQEVPTAVVVLHVGTSAKPDDLVAHVESRLARYKIPRVIRIVDSLPHTGSGKVDKRTLSAEAESRRVAPHGS